MGFDAQQGFRLGDRMVYPALNRVISGNDELTVEGKVMDVLVVLALHAGGVVSKNRLLDEVWPNQSVSDGVVARAIHELRRALDDSAHSPRYIQNVPRVGYRLLQTPAPIAPLAITNARPMRKYAIAAIVAALAVCIRAWYSLGPDYGEAPIDSIAVLPFVNMTGDSNRNFVTDGLTEEVIHLMAQQPRLHVAARTSSFLIRDKKLSVAEIGEQLNVDAIVEGSVRQERGTQRITLQLIRTATGTHEGSITVDVREDDIFAAQQLLGEAIVSMLHAAGADVDVERTAAIKPVNVLAYDFYLRARHALHQRSAESLQDAHTLLQEALRLDPDLAQAHAALAQLYVVARYYLGLPKDAAERNKRAAYQKALSIDPNNVDAIVVAATDAADRKDWDLAVEHFRTAMRLYPGNSITHLWYGQFLIMVGHTSEGREHVEKAVHLDPLAGSTNTVMAFAAACFPDDKRMLAAARQADQVGARLAPRFLALHAFRRGDIEVFERELARAFLNMDIDPVAAKSIADAARDPSQRGQLTAKLAPHGTRRNNFFARELAQLGLHDEALEALLRQPTFEGTFMSDIWSPEFAGLRALPGFIDLIRKLGVAEFWQTFGLPDVCRGTSPEGFCEAFSDLAT